MSPVLANLFMHYAFDSWLEREFPAVEFERFADDAVVHCATERQSLQVRAALSERLEEAGLRLHPDKTKVVYCKDRKRRRDYECTSFTFLGYTFRARKAPTRDGKSMFAAFLPAISGGRPERQGSRNPRVAYQPVPARVGVPRHRHRVLGEDLAEAGYLALTAHFSHQRGEEESGVSARRGRPPRRRGSPRTGGWSPVGRVARR